MTPTSEWSGVGKRAARQAQAHAQAAREARDLEIARAERAVVSDGEPPYICPWCDQALEPGRHQTIADAHYCPGKAV